MLLFSLFSTEHAGRMTTKIYSHYCKSWSHIEPHGKLGLPLCPVVMDTRCNNRATESRYAGKLQGIWFYGVCKSLLKNFTSCPFDIECPLSTPPAWHWVPIISPTSFSFHRQELSDTSLDPVQLDYNKVFIVFLLLLCLLGPHSTQVHIKCYHFLLFLKYKNVTGSR